jgi:hypothetical protein
MPSIFISYRRGDSERTVGRLVKGLGSEFGSDSIFFDVDVIPIGMDFRNVLRDAVSKTDVMLVLIGPDWLTASDYDGKRRLEDPHDFVRMEIELGLQIPVPVVPVLLDRASLPRSDEVPDSLRPLLYCQVLSISSLSFRSDFPNLLQAIRSIRSKDSDTRKVGAPRWKVKMLSAFASLLGVRSALGAATAADTDATWVQADPLHLKTVRTASASGGDEVFISYSRDDVPIMHKVRQHLANRKFKRPFGAATPAARPPAPPAGGHTPSIALPACPARCGSPASAPQRQAQRGLDRMRGMG